MLLKFSFIKLFVFFGCHSFAMATESVELGRFLDVLNKSTQDQNFASINTRQILKQEAAPVCVPMIRSERTLRFETKNKESSKSLSAVYEKIKRARILKTAAKLSAGILKQGARIAIDVQAGLMDEVPLPGSSTVSSLYGNQMRDATDFVSDLASGYLNDKMAELLSNTLENDVVKPGNMTQDEFEKYVREKFPKLLRNDPKFKELYENSSEKDKLVFQKRLVDDALRVGADNKLNIEANRKQLKGVGALSVQNMNDIVAVKATLDAFAKETIKRVDDLKITQDKLKNSISKVTLRAQNNSKIIKINKNNIALNSRLISKNRKDVDFLKVFAKSRMNSKEVLEAYETGFLEATPEKIEKQKVIIARDEFIDKTQKVLALAGAIGALGEKFGIPEELSKKISLGVSAANTALNVGKSLASGNYFAAVTSLVGFMGGMGKSAEQMRHEQIMKALSALMEGQKQIIENQKKIMQALNSLHKTVVSNHIALMKKLDKEFDTVKVELALGRKMQNQIIEHQVLSDCYSYFSHMKQISPINSKPLWISERSLGLQGWELNVSALDFTDYTKRMQYFERNKSKWFECRSGLSKLLAPNSSKEPNAFFVVDAKNSSDVVYANKNHFSKLVYFLSDALRYYKTESGLGHLHFNSLLNSLTVRSTRSDHLVSKIKSIPLLKSGNSFKFDNFSSELITSKLKSVVDVILGFEEYFPLIKNIQTPESAKLYSVAELMKHMNSSSVWEVEGYNFLLKLREFIDLARMQKNLMSGDVLLPYFKAEVESIGAIDVKFQIIDLLKKNSLLAKNFVSYLMFTSNLKNVSAQPSVSRYKVAFNRNYNDQLISDYAPKISVEEKAEVPFEVLTEVICFKDLVEKIQGNNPSDDKACFYTAEDAKTSAKWYLRLSFKFKEDPKIKTVEEKVLVVPFPSPHDLKNGVLEASAEQKELDTMLELVDERLFSYEFPQYLNSKDQEALFGAFCTN